MGVSLQAVIDEPLLAVMPADAPLVTRPPGRADIPLAELRDRPLISLPRGTGVRGALDRACARAGFQPRIAFEAAAPHLLARLAARGLGVAVLPASSTGTAPALGMRTLTITQPALRARIALAWRTGGPGGLAARTLLKQLRTSW
ncbi:LysR family transcriptional regulator substrate-binding protein [Actinomadura sp. 7K507]|uniref:LysR family transcriptional regulator substrate-binding protein n=1 Tax=Actinomadura sp. 7K507 TaxID=2530365 RepID=UPI001FB61828|nr:LysR family transcriptional regulator substrate-binding protein [Actinomadura sp. 7K507]